MSRCNQLKQEAAQLRGQIDHRAGVICQRIESLKHQVRNFARSPAALPVAFACGILAGRLYLPGIKRIYGLLSGQLRSFQVISSLMGSYQFIDLLTALQYQRET